jgi:hypothetical protein
MEPKPAGPEDVKVTLPLVHTDVEDAATLLKVGFAFTVTITVELQPPDTIYDIIAVPALTPVTTPVPEAAVAIPEALLLHVPLGVVFESVVVPDAHSVKVPVLVGGLLHNGVIITCPLPRR